MDRYQFEDNISNYIENSLTLNKRKEFEEYMESNPDAVELVERVRSTMGAMKSLPKVNSSSDFMDKLLNRIEIEKNRSPQIHKPQQTVFGFTPLYASLMSVVIVGLVFVGLSMIPESTQNSGVVTPTHFTGKSEMSQPVQQKQDDFMVEVEEDSVEFEDSNKDRFENRIHLVKDSNPSFK